MIIPNAYILTLLLCQRSTTTKLNSVEFMCEVISIKCRLKPTIYFVKNNIYFVSLLTLQ